jgi:hypothetical protein
MAGAESRGRASQLSTFRSAVVRELSSYRSYQVVARPRSRLPSRARTSRRWRPCFSAVTQIGSPPHQPEVRTALVSEIVKRPSFASTIVFPHDAVVLGPEAGDDGVVVGECHRGKNRAASAVRGLHWPAMARRPAGPPAGRGSPTEPRREKPARRSAAAGGLTPEPGRRGAGGGDRIEQTTNRRVMALD